MLGRFVTDKMFRTAVVRIADIRAEATAGSATWVYGFSWVSPTMGWSVHCLDVPFWFDCLDADGVTAIAGDAPPAALAAAVHGAATAFVRDGDPGWTAMDDRREDGTHLRRRPVDARGGHRRVRECLRADVSRDVRRVWGAFATRRAGRRGVSARERAPNPGSVS